MKAKKGYLNIFVDKLSKKKGKILYIETIDHILGSAMGELYTRTKGYKAIHLAKNRGNLMSLKKDLYYVPQKNDDIDDIIQKRYRHILHNHIKTYLNGTALITGVPALQILLQNYEIPDAITLITPNKQCVETIVGNKKAIIKKMNQGKNSLYTTYKKTAKKVSIGRKSFYMTSLTVSLLEAMYSQTNHSPRTTELCKKVLKKYRKHLDREEVVSFIRKGKYHTSLNKLHRLARGLDDAYANHIMSLIKKHSYRITSS